MKTKTNCYSNCVIYLSALTASISLSGTVHEVYNLKFKGLIFNTDLYFIFTKSHGKANKV